MANAAAQHNGRSGRAERADAVVALRVGAAAPQGALDDVRARDLLQERPAEVSAAVLQITRSLGTAMVTDLTLKLTV